MISSKQKIETVVENIKNIMSVNNIDIQTVEEPKSDEEFEFDQPVLPINPMSSSSSSSIKQTKSKFIIEDYNPKTTTSNKNLYEYSPPTTVYQSNDALQSSTVSSKELDRIHKLATRFVPVFVFRSDEKAFPIAINDLTLKDTTVFASNTDNVALRAAPTVQFLTENSNIKQNSTLLWSEKSLHQKYDPSTCFVHYCYTAPQYSPSGLTLLQYFLEYRVNDAFKCCGCCPCEVGFHQGDLEHISIYIDEKDEKIGPIIDRVYFSAHSNAQGQWKKRPEIEYYDEKQQRIVAYIARGSHAFYPTGGTQWRVFGVANDICAKGVGSEDSIVWNVQPNQMIEADENNPLWMKYPGYMGYPDNCRTPVNSSWWKRERGTQVSAFKRFFGCFKPIFGWCGPDLPYHEPI